MSTNPMRKTAQVCSAVPNSKNAMERFSAMIPYAMITWTSAIISGGWKSYKGPDSKCFAGP